MEKQQYIVEREQINQHLKRVGVPSNAIIHYWYELDSSSANTSNKKKQIRKSIRTAPAFGIWKDRDDMKDPSEYVREMRKPRSFQ